MSMIEHQQLQDLARASIAAARIVEAHADKSDRICRVVLELSDVLRHLPLREAILQRWYEDGFIASTSRDGKFLMIDGLRGEQPVGSDAMALVNQVAEQLKHYTRQSMRRDAQAQAIPPSELISQSGDQAAESLTH